MQLLQGFNAILGPIFSINIPTNKIHNGPYKIKNRKHNPSIRILISNFFIILFFWSILLYPQSLRQADYYFDAVNGNNSNSGTSPFNAKKDLDGLASIIGSLSGKTVAFRDSMYYRRTSSNTSAVNIPSNVTGVTLTNWWDGLNWDYGYSKLPVIAASYKISNWTNYSGNIWTATGSGNNTLVFAYTDSIRWGLARSSIGACTKERDFYQTGSTYYVYSPEDPDIRYESIDSYRQSYGIDNYGSNNTFDHLDIRYANGGGIVLNYGGSGCTIQYSNVQYNGSSQGLLAGQGSEGVYINASNSTARYNYVRENTHHQFFCYNFSGQSQDNILIEHNVSVNGHYNHFDMNGGGTWTNIVIQYNIAYEEPWADYRQESNYTGRNGGFWTNGGVQSVTVAYNLIYDLYDVPMMDFRVGAIHLYNNTFVQSRPGTTQNIIYSSGGSGSVFKNNIFYPATGGGIGSTPSGSSNNVTSNPTFVNFSSSDFSKRNFHLQSTSSAIDFGTPLGYTIDLDGNPIVGNPDAGVYEYQAGGGGNNPPNQPSNPNPGNGSTGQSINSTINWTCTDPDGDPLTYDVYFGTNSNPALVASNQSNSNYNPGTLINSTTYYWKIVAKDNQGASATGPVWNFTTETGGGGNNPPNQPSNPDPANGTVNQPTNSTVNWTCADPDGDPLTYDVYFGTNNNPQLVSSNQSNSNYNPGTLNNITTYYWKIVAKDNQGASTTGPVWNFTTISVNGEDTTPPELVGVQIVETDHVVLDFSEPLDGSQINNLGNYTISEQVPVLEASLSPTLQRITLTTGSHQANHVYTIQVDNITDTAGNVISSQANSLFYKKLDIGTTGYIEHLIENVDASTTTDTNTSPLKTLDGLVNGDPDPNSRWAAEVMPQWIQYDLGVIKPINVIALSFYQWNNGRVYEYSIQSSDDEVTWNNVVLNASSSNQEWTLNEINSLSARYIRVVCLSNNVNDWAGLWEARIVEETGVTAGDNNDIPKTFNLAQNFPNPFNPSTTVQYSVADAGLIKIAVYNVIGQEIARLVNEEKQPGTYNITFDASNLPSGIYFCRMEANDFTSTRKMILLK